VRQAVDLREPTRVQVDRDALAGAHEIAVGVVAVQDERLRLRIADAATQLRGRSFLDLELDVDQVGRARHRLRFRFDPLDVGQALQALLGALDQRVRQPCSLELAHLAPQHFVVDLGDAVEHDVAHVGAVAGIDEERQRNPSWSSLSGVGTGSTLAKA
jgi:hypothetical protein